MEGIVREFGMGMYTLLYLKCIADNVLLYIAWETLLNVMWQPGRKGNLGGRTDTCICVSEFLCCLAEAIICINIGYTPIQNKKLKRMLSTPNLPYSALLLSPKHLSL